MTYVDSDLGMENDPVLPASAFLEIVETVLSESMAELEESMAELDASLEDHASALARFMFTLDWLPEGVSVNLPTRLGEDGFIEIDEAKATMYDRDGWLELIAAVLFAVDEKKLEVTDWKLVHERNGDRYVCCARWFPVTETLSETFSPVLAL